MPLYSHPGLAISRPLPLFFVLSGTFAASAWQLYLLSWRKNLDTVSLLTVDGDGNYDVLEIRCYVAREDHVSEVISTMAEFLLIFQAIQLFAQAVLISQKRRARIAKTLSILLISVTLACVIAITIKARNLVKVLQGPGPLPEWETHCSEARGISSRFYDVWNTSDTWDVSGVRPVVIACAVDCALKLFLILCLFVLPTSIKIPIPFEPIVTGPKARSLVQSDGSFPEMGPVSEAWKNFHCRSLSRDHVSEFNVRYFLAAISTLTNTKSNTRLAQLRFLSKTIQALHGFCLND
jgi:DNA-binding protein H-NS